MSKSRDVQALPQSIRPTAGCLFCRPPLCQKQTTTCGMDMESSECVARRHVLKSISDGKCDMTCAVASQQPALIGKTIKPVVTEDEMVEQPDAQ